jgi:formylmethanofuran dehydrogenase subunit B
MLSAVAARFRQPAVSPRRREFTSMKNASPGDESSHGFTPADGEAEGGHTVVCTACPMLCDDIVLAATRAERACEFGAGAFAAAAEARHDAAEAWDDDGPVPLDTALDRAARLIETARRVLVTGLAGATLEAVTRACDLAESLGAAIDAGLVESSQPAGPTVARVGEVTAAWEELRDRADLVVFWFHDPAVTHPRFIERFLPVAAGGRQGRRTIAVGPDAVLTPGPEHRHIPLPSDHSVEAARLLHARLAGLPAVRQPEAAPPGASAAVAAAASELERSMRSAACVAIITGERAAGVGVEPWSIAHVTRLLAHEKPAFAIPLSAGIHAGGANAAGAAAVCTWRYGAAGAIARADRAGGMFLPGEASAGRLIERGEVDCVLAVGPLAAGVEDAIRGRHSPLSIVRLGDGAAGPGTSTRASIRIRCAGLPAVAGTMLREDGRRIVLPPRPATAGGRPLEEILAGLAARMRRCDAGQAAGAAS